ncbi:hypothetical protein VRRI112168_12860 [Vreelandella rituensis]
MCAPYPPFPGNVAECHQRGGLDTQRLDGGPGEASLAPGGGDSKPGEMTHRHRATRKGRPEWSGLWRLVASPTTEQPTAQKRMPAPSRRKVIASAARRKEVSHRELECQPPQLFTFPLRIVQKRHLISHRPNAKRRVSSSALSSRMRFIARLTSSWETLVMVSSSCQCLKKVIQHC